VAVGGERQWAIEFSDEVRDWLAGLDIRGLATAQRHIDRLAALGPHLPMPWSRPLGDGLLELRLTVERKEQRITYYVDPERLIITLTTFRKQRQNERREIERARRVRTRRMQERK